MERRDQRYVNIAATGCGLDSPPMRSREMFVPLTHAPGEAQADFGEALVVIAGVEQKAYYLAHGSAALGRLLSGHVSG